VPPINPIVHSIEGVNALGFVEVIKPGIVGIHIICILHLHQICNEIWLQNTLQSGWVRVLLLCSFAKNRFFLFFGNLHFGPIILTWLLPFVVDQTRHFITKWCFHSKLYNEGHYWGFRLPPDAPLHAVRYLRNTSVGGDQGWCIDRSWPWLWSVTSGQWRRVMGGDGGPGFLGILAIRELLFVTKIWFIQSEYRYCLWAGKGKNGNFILLPRKQIQFTKL